MEELTANNSYSVMIFSSEKLEDDAVYYLYSGENMLSESSDGNRFGGGPNGHGGPGNPPPDNRF